VARRLKWSEEAWADLDEIAEYIARDSRAYAAAFVRKIREVARSLVEMAERGRIVPEHKNPMVREIIIGNYRLVYRITQDEVGIAGVIHGARQLPPR
jgi:plasmid stabilization system protein ParE